MVYTFSNLDVTNITSINNFKFNDNTNIVYLNNIINTDSNYNYNISFDNSNSTFIIDNIHNPIYKKKISQVSKQPKQLFTSNNHNLKINDLITLQNIKKNNINILNDSLITNYTIYKVTETTRNTFRIKSFNNFSNSINNISNILKSSAILNNAYFSLHSSKTFKLVTSILNQNIITVPNHTFSINNIITFHNPTNLNSIYSNSTFKITNIDLNSITIVDSLNNNTNLFTNLSFPHTITNHMYIQLIQSSNLSKNITITLPSLTNSTDFGSFYNFIINDNISSFSLKTSPGDILLGTNKFYSSQLISSNLIQSSDNSNQFKLENLDLLYSKIKIINISTNKWYINSEIYNNTFKYTVKYDSTNQKFLFNNSVLAQITFYQNFIYEFDLSDTSLLQSNFIIVDSNDFIYLKNTNIVGIPGHFMSKIIIYFDNTNSIDSQFKLKYKLTPTSTVFSFTALGIVKSYPSPFTIV